MRLMQVMLKNGDGLQFRPSGLSDSDLGGMLAKSRSCWSSRIMLTFCDSPREWWQSNGKGWLVASQRSSMMVTRGHPLSWCSKVYSTCNRGLPNAMCKATEIKRHQVYSVIMGGVGVAGTKPSTDEPNDHPPSPSWQLVGQGKRVGDCDAR